MELAADEATGRWNWFGLGQMRSWSYATAHDKQVVIVGTEECGDFPSS